MLSDKLNVRLRVNRRKENRHRFAIESLETRTVLSGTSIHVDTFDDVVDSSDGQTSLREAVAAAVASDGSDLILLEPGHYSLSQGQLDIQSANGRVVIQSTGAGADAVIDAQSSSRVFAISDSTVVLKRLTITDGDSRGSAGDSNGGGIRNIGSHLTITDSRVSGNIAPDGGGILNAGGAELMVINSEVSNNQAVDDSGDFGNGGGITNVNATIMIKNSLLVGNSAVRAAGNGNGGFGGGIISVGEGPASHQASLINTVVASNTANGGGGGIAVFSVGGATGALTVRNSVVSNNVVGGSGLQVGGGIWLLGIFGGTNHATIRNSSISFNFGGVDGGGIYLSGTPFGASIVHVINSQVVSNRAGNNGGGVWNDSGLVLERSLIASNTAGDQGGGVYNTVIGTFDADKQTSIEGNVIDDVFVA